MNDITLLCTGIRLPSIRITHLPGNDGNDCGKCLSQIMPSAVVMSCLSLLSISVMYAVDKDHNSSVISLATLSVCVCVCVCLCVFYDEILVVVVAVAFVLVAVWNCVSFWCL